VTRAVKATAVSAARPRLGFVPRRSGVYYAVVTALDGAPPYTLETAVDGDGDGRPDTSDDCPSVANASQSDWNRNGRGDACDRSSKTSIDRVKLDAGRLFVFGRVLPAGARPAAWIVEVRKGRRIVARAHGFRSGGGHVWTALRLPARVHGRVSVRALLVDRRYERASSRAVLVRAG
jgi:hypothetical protein